MARRHGALSLVDGAHAFGLVPVSMAAIRPDFYAANIHKWMMGAAGSAFLYVAPDCRERIAPLVTTASFAYQAAQADEPVYPMGPTRWVHSHEYQGTRNMIPLLTVKTAVRFHEELGLTAIHARTGPLAALCRERFQALGFKLATPTHAAIANCMVAFHWPATASEPQGGRAPNTSRASYRLRQEYHHEVGVPSLADGRPLLRVSCAWFNTEAEIERFATLAGSLDFERLGE